jgi:hypothetical protein
VLSIDEGVAISGLEDSLHKLRKMEYKLEKDELLSALEKAECVALTALVTEKLWKCQVGLVYLLLTFQLYDLWTEVENYETFTKISYSHNASFPLKLWLDRERKKNMKEYLTLSGYDDLDKVITPSSLVEHQDQRSSARNL